MRRTILLLASMAVVLVLGAGAAFAVLTSVSGGSIFRVDIDRENSVSFTNSTSFVPIPGASVGVTVPSGTTRLVMARLSGVSSCFGANTAFGTGCLVQIEARNNATGVITVLQPNSAGSFFDTSNSGKEPQWSWESHSMDRSGRLGAGSYTISPKFKVNAANVTFQLNEWSFTVEQAT